MGALTVVVSYSYNPLFNKMLSEFVESGLFDCVKVVCDRPVEFQLPRCSYFVADSLLSGQTLKEILDGVKTEYLLLLHDAMYVSFEPKAIGRLIGTAVSSGAGLVYSDFYDETEKTKTVHPLNDYQIGSIRDDFDFGAIILFSIKAIRNALKKHGQISPVGFAGLYDLRLKVSIDNPVYHINEPLYSVIRDIESSDEKRHFAYVDPKNIDVQKEMEAVFTDYLKKIEAYIPYECLRETNVSKDSFPVMASVIIPVKNRKNTINGAIKSVLSQKTDFPFNIIVVDNHSKDGTTSILTRLTGQYPAVKHIIPAKTDLGIGGCWNEALYSPFCGRYAVQLDSDDLYSSPHTLKRIIDTLQRDNYAMVIGSYTIVDFDLNVMPPGLIDHREWTDNNGHNNALRINGLGAPRAFDTTIIRNIGFLNVSYGEDYAASLRICREYRIGRIFDSIYLCRRWEGNTDAVLSLEDTNRNNYFKDKIRTNEIIARQAIKKGSTGRKG